jgi:uncharacterized YigZ family protein
LETESDSYLTIEGPATGIFKDKGSRFLAYAWPVVSEAEVKTLVDKYKKEYFDARHHCYAYRLGPEALQIRANDDGEPSGTAGKPILGQLVSQNLTNVLVVVVRYFGGTLLGTSGLINAYREATANALANAQITKRFVYAIYQINFGYLQMNSVMKIVKDAALETFEQSFELSCSLMVKIRKSQELIIMEKFSTAESVETVFIGDV